MGFLGVKYSKYCSSDFLLLRFLWIGTGILNLYESSLQSTNITFLKLSCQRTGSKACRMRQRIPNSLLEDFMRLPSFEELFQWYCAWNLARISLERLPPKSARFISYEVLSILFAWMVLSVTYRLAATLASSLESAWTTSRCWLHGGTEQVDWTFILGLAVLTYWFCTFLWWHEDDWNVDRSWEKWRSSSKAGCTADNRWTLSSRAMTLRTSSSSSSQGDQYCC